jgi:glycosyltransferase involved in cell wall biosynthesis
MQVRVLFLTRISLSPSSTMGDRMLALGLFDKGIEITVVTDHPTTETRQLEKHGLKLVYIPIENKISLNAIIKIRALLKENKFDILHMTYGKAVTNGLIASIGMDIKRIAFFGSMSLHWYDPTAYLSFLNPYLDKIICVSDAVKDHLRRQLSSKNRHKAIRIYRGFDPGWIDKIVPVTRESLVIPMEAFVICFVGNLRRIKGLPYLIKSVNYLPDNLNLYFLLVGTGTDSKTVRKLIDNTKYQQNFRVTGEVPVAPAYTSICDLYIQPSVSEGLGRAVIEAMSLKKPVIVTDHGGAKELIINNVNGFIIPAKSSEAIAATIQYCLKNQGILSDLGYKARERILHDFDSESTINQTIILFNSLLKIMK